MRYIAILCNDLQPRNGVAVSHNVIEYVWAILLDPFQNKTFVASCVMQTYQGSSYGRSDPIGLDAEAMRDASRCDNP